jgi:hypothetical protein
MATAEQIATELAVIVNLAIQQHPDRAIFVADRLPASGNVDNAEAAMTEANTGANIDAVVVRPAMPKRVRHAADRCLRNGGVAVSDEDTANSTHLSAPA